MIKIDYFVLALEMVEVKFETLVYFGVTTNKVVQLEGDVQSLQMVQKRVKKSTILTNSVNIQVLYRNSLRIFNWRVPRFPTVIEFSKFKDAFHENFLFW